MSGHELPGAVRAAPAAASASSARAAAESSAELPAHLESLGRKILLSEVARLVAHEVNNHLQGIIGLADLVGDEVSDPAWKASLVQIKLQAERIAELQRSLSGLIQPLPPARDELQPVDLGNLWRRIEDIAHGAFTRRQVQPTVTLPEDLPPVAGDAQAISDLLMVVVLWHFRSMERREAWGEDKPQLEIIARAVTNEKGRAVEWTSRDNGAGVPAVMKPPPSPQEHPELYDDLTTFGLVYMLQIINRHQARLAVQSDAATGLEFQITIPAL